MLRCLQQITQAAHAARIPVSICGEMAGDLEYTPILLGLGFDQLSMNAGSIPKVKRLIREVHHSACQKLLAEVLTCTTAQQAEQRLRTFMLENVSFASSLLRPLT